MRQNTRPALLDERVRRNAAGKMEFNFKTPWSDSTVLPVMPPLERVQRLADLVPGQDHALPPAPLLSLDGGFAAGNRSR